jgi:hypothetical protein
MKNNKSLLLILLLSIAPVFSCVGMEGDSVSDIEEDPVIQLMGVETEDDDDNPFYDDDVGADLRDADRCGNALRQGEDCQGVEYYSERLKKCRDNLQRYKNGVVDFVRRDRPEADKITKGDLIRYKSYLALRQFGRKEDSFCISQRKSIREIEKQNLEEMEGDVDHVIGDMPTEVSELKEPEVPAVTEAVANPEPQTAIIPYPKGEQVPNQEELERRVLKMLTTVPDESDLTHKMCRDIINEQQRAATCAVAEPVAVVEAKSGTEKPGQPKTPVQPKKPFLRKERIIVYSVLAGIDTKFWVDANKELKEKEVKLKTVWKDFFTPSKFNQTREDYPKTSRAIMVTMGLGLTIGVDAAQAKFLPAKSE